MIIGNATRVAVTLIGLAMLPVATPSAAAGATGKCTLARIAEWQVRPTRGQPIVDGAINGQKVGILLDTGATRSIIVRSAADHLGLVRYDSRGSRMMGIGGEIAVEVVSIDEFAIGTDVRRNLRLLVAGEHDLGADVAVLLGEDFFRQSEVEFDLAHEAIRLFQSRDCEGRSLAYWSTEGATVVEFEAIFEANPAIYFTVEVNGRPVRALLDSGAFPSVLTRSQAAALGVAPDTAGVIGGGCSLGLGQKTIEFWIGSFNSFRIGDELIRNPSIRFADLWKYSTMVEAGSRLKTRPGDRPDMLLGADFLRSHRVLVAHSQRNMYFTYAGGTVFPKLPFGKCDDASRREAGMTPAPDSK
jgi:clan AA aspartic protease (TIGR02281 family)